MSSNRSPHGKIVAFDATLWSAGDDPVDVTLMRDGVANGLLHTADSCGQVRAAHVFAKTGIKATGTSYMEIATPTAGTWYLMDGGVLGAWPLTIDSDGTPYHLRVRLRGATSNAAGSCSFRLVLAPISESSAIARAELTRAVDHVWEATGVTSTTHAWLTGASKGVAAETNRMIVSSLQAREWVQRTQVPDAVSGASLRTVEQVTIGLHVFAKTANATGVPRVSGYYAAEYYAG